MKVVAIAPDGQTVAAVIAGNLISSVGLTLTVQESRLVLWNLVKDKQIHELQIRPDSGLYAFSPDGKVLCGASVAGIVQRWDVATGKEISLGENDIHRDPVYAVAFSPDGKRVASVDQQQFACVWHAQTGRVLRNLAPEKMGGGTIAFAPDGRQLLQGLFALSGNGKTLATMKILEPTNPEAWPAALMNGTLRTEIQISSPSSYKVLRRFGENEKAMMPMALSADGQWLATAARGVVNPLWPVDAKSGSSVVLWDVFLGRPAREFTLSSPLVGVAFGSDAKTMVTASATGLVQVWDIATGRELVQFQHMSPGQQRVVNMQFALSPDGKWVATADYFSNVVLWQTKTGMKLGSFKGHLGAPTCLTFSRDSRLLASGSSDTTVLIWEVKAIL